ncbi:MAG: cystathionine gamma-synthase [Planctomycetaceae bacterium]|nr:cystathionine gamma-synthase [Planctomycetaceae bacterium]|tara:strand:- start:2340 stop:3530 length:1191 start_codon:yes stop_codon:yes gene_type:complete
MVLQNDQNYGESTRSVHGGEGHQKALDSITDPIVMASTYTFSDTQAVIDYIEEKQQRGEYGRYGNPNESVVERKLANLEGGQDAVLFSSGMAAIVGVIMAKLNAGDEVVFFDECYHRSREFCSQHMSRFGVITRQVEACNYDAMEAAITSNTKLLVSESPTNPHLSVVDLERFAEIGKRKGIETLIDATLATPHNIKPLSYGVDYVLHSATKYLAGHNDLLAGAIIGNSDKLEDIRYLRGILGSINSAHNCYLLQRGLKTFDVRMERHNKNGQAIAEFLEMHPRVSKVYYPGLASHKYHEVAVKQMNGFGGLITFELANADWRETADVVDRCTIPKIAPSLGGVESLIEQPLIMSYYELPAEERASYGIRDNMIRMAIGIEDTEDLIQDLKQALAG